MLVLSRKQGEEIVIANVIRIRVLRITGNRVTLGVTAPPAYVVLRDEVAARMKAAAANQEGTPIDVIVGITPETPEPPKQDAA